MLVVYTVCLDIYRVYISFFPLQPMITIDADDANSVHGGSLTYETIVNRMEVRTFL